MTKHPCEVIKELMAMGYTQTKIALLTSVPQPTISRILHGVSKSPRWEHAASLQAVLNEVRQPQSKKSAKRGRR